MYFKTAKRWRGALIFLFSATTALFATQDTLGPFTWTISATNATVYASYSYSSSSYSCNPTIGGVALPYGSIIAAVDTAGHCIGAQKWERGTVGISVQGWDSTYDSTHHTPIVTRGLKSGQKFRFELWDSATNATVTFVHAHFAAHGSINGIIPNADSTYDSAGGAADISLLDTLMGTATVNLAVPLSNGYNLYSLNVHPADSSTTGIFKGLKGFLLAEDAYTNTWWPLGGVTTELDTLNTGSGYWIFDTSSTDTLKVTGAPDVSTTPISLLGLSYDLVAYLPQVNMPFETALASLLSPADTQLIIAEDGAGENIYWPAGGLFPTVDSMYAGTGYVMVTNANATLIYPSGSVAKQIAAVSGKPHMSQPPLRHYTKHSITGNSEILLSRQVEIGGKPASGNCEVGAFDTKGNLVGAGSVVNGVTAFNIWGQDPLTRAKDGCAPSEKISFRLWDGSKEYPLAVAGGNPVYAAKTILSVTLGVPAGANMSSFALPRLHPNPFRASVTIAFDVPAISGSADQEVEIGVYDMRGSLVQRLAKARYAPGSYSVTWNGRAAGSVPGSGVYMVRMTANGFDKQVKLIEIK
jgi:hypothetical protein